MGKRLIRIRRELITASKQKLQNSVANIVLTTGGVSNGYIIEVSDQHVTLKNKRSKRLQFAIEDINEIVIDN